MNTIGTLIIARHHESEWNKLGLWTGIRDRHLTPYGFDKSREMGLALTGVRIDRAFASMQVRSIETLSSMLDALGIYRIPVEHSAALNERDYGEYTGKDKWDMLKEIGEDRWNAVRRNWQEPIPGGETLKDVYERVVPFYESKVLPSLLEGQNVLIVAHGNSLRSLIKYLERISDEDIKDVEMPFGGIYLYKIGPDGKSLGKESRSVSSEVHA